MKTPLIMTPGPTYVHEDVRRALSREITNPDLDEQFYEFYKDTCEQLKKVFQTKNEVLILNGEGILGLEAACASLIEENDKVLCIDNGIFGNGFGDFAKIYGADVTYYKSDYKNAVSAEGLEEFLKENHNFKLATLVHCETPSGITILSVSDDAWAAVFNRKKPVGSFYCNLGIWKDWYKNQWFPYTQPISDIYALREAVDRLLCETDSVQRHKRIADAVRKSVIRCGLKLYPDGGYSNTVTAVLVPEEIPFQEIYRRMLQDHHILIAGASQRIRPKPVLKRRQLDFDPSFK